MKVNYKSSNGRLSIEVDAETQKEVFSKLSQFQEVFEQTTCGKCGHDDLRFVVRMVEDNDFYELHCLKCRARLAFGQHKGKEGTLFPRRKDGDGTWLPNSGWMKYNPETKKDE